MQALDLARTACHQRNWSGLRDRCSQEVDIAADLDLLDELR